MSRRNRSIAGKYGRAAFVCAVIAAGAGLRIAGIGGGLPDIVHPDEGRQLLDALGMAERGSLVPAEFSYPALHKHLLMAVSGGYYLVGRALGWFASPVDFAMAFLTGSGELVLLARLLSAAAGVALIAVLYRTAAAAWSKEAGVAALVFASGMYHLIQHSQWAIADILLALFVALSFHHAFRSLRVDGSFAWALLYAGLAAATKPQGLFLLAPIALAGFLRLKDRGFRADLAFIRTAALGSALFVATALLGNLAWLFEFKSAYAKFLMLNQVARLGISSAEPFTPGALSLLVWLAKELVRQETALGAVLAGGFVYALVKRSREDLLALSYAAVFTFAVKDWAIRYLHLFVGLMPVMVLLGGRAFAALAGRTGARSALVYAFALAIVLPSAADSLEVSLAREGRDTRLLARSWIEANIPAGSAIAMDWYEFSVPLEGGAPRALQNPKAREYFERSAPPGLKAAWVDYSKGRPAYRLIPIVYTTEVPNWPAEMDQAAIEAASAMEVYRELYSVFNFRTLAELKSSGAAYAVISSYSYANFLLDTDPRKSRDRVFNYLVKEDLLSFNSHSDFYKPGDRFALLYFLGRRARDFYLPLLDGRAAPLVKEFRPGPGSPGPHIGIYRLI